MDKLMFLLIFCAGSLLLIGCLAIAEVSKTYEKLRQCELSNDDLELKEMIRDFVTTNFKKEYGEQP
ncbi:hypothetical protein UFOVP353_40 [uncultured Caudovirales phage]|uniref:Uncharacterized protein n=1 Tax=uncultured Caudovirales phage TaxID=2100421 RepID=A0A6J5M7P0_9CAUD|nr:hypothetical protein UFOVP353_40 [uncultured Caudovirales phage]